MPDMRLPYAYQKDQATTNPKLKKALVEANLQKINNDQQTQATPKGTTMNSTYFGLLAEFNTAEIPLEKVCTKYFGLKEKTAYEHASINKFPVPTYRAGSQKSGRLVSASVLAEHIDTCKLKAETEWKKFNNIS